VQQGLLPRASRRRGPGTTYPDDFVDRLLLIRRLQKEQSLTLSHIREVLDSGRGSTIHRVAHGKEPLEIRLSASEEEIAERAHRNEETLSLRSRFFRKRKPALRPEPKPAGIDRPDFAELSAQEFGRDIRAADRMLLRPQLEGGHGERRYPIGKNSWLVVDKELTPLQQKRLSQMVVLLRSILEEDD
jgi:DNA-binding transcriptional MerR regulator